MTICGQTMLPLLLLQAVLEIACPLLALMHLQQQQQQQPAVILTASGERSLLSHCENRRVALTQLN